MSPRKQTIPARLWLLWIVTVVTVPWMPVSKWFENGGADLERQCWIAYSLIFAASLVIGACHPKPRKWNLEGMVETVVLGFGLSMIGLLISATVGFGGCVLTGFSKL